SCPIALRLWLPGLHGAGAVFRGHHPGPGRCRGSAVVVRPGRWRRAAHAVGAVPAGCVNRWSSSGLQVLHASTLRIWLSVCSALLGSLAP
nr:hypothetical protein [Tanacetum cinerariifolium]